MKIKRINPDLLLETWKAGVENLLFPDNLVEDLKPVAVLDEWGDGLPDMREKYRDDVDIFIGNVFETETPEELWSLLRKTDSRIMALYYDRILAAAYSLGQLEAEIVEVPESWDTLARMLLFQEFSL